MYLHTLVILSIQYLCISCSLLSFRSRLEVLECLKVNNYIWLSDICDNTKNSYLLILQPKTLITKLAEDLKPEHMATLKSAKAFTRMLQSFRATGKQTISETFVLPESYLIMYVFII